MTVTAYFDYGGVRDWSCGSNTYAGHRGTDFAPYGSWTAMDEGRSVVAAAAGEVIASHDGEFDRCSSGDCAGGGGFGNYVAIRHDDGKVTYYAHLRTGTVRFATGDRVSCGQEVGLVGSSGYSTGPHVHFEVRPGGGAADDPFGGGDCSGPLSYWVEQGAYRALPGTTCESMEPPPTDDAAVTSVSPEPGSRVEAGSRFEVRVVVRNTGNTTWTDGAAYLLTHDGDARFDAPEQVRLDGASVAPDATHEFRFDATAPTTAGEQIGYWRMDRFGTARFGERAQIRVLVEERPPPTPDSGIEAPDGSIAPPAGDAAVRDAGGAARDAAPPAIDGATGARPLGDESLSGGCGCETAGAPRRSAAARWLVAIGLVAVLAAACRGSRLRTRSARGRPRRA